jgi:uncharacterized protein
VSSHADVLIMAKPAGPRCNLACSYCYYLGKAGQLFSGAPASMPDALLEDYIRQRFESSPCPNTHFEWHGGEPTLLGVEFFERVTALQRKHTSPDRTYTNGIQTNGVLLDEHWAEMLAREGFSVGLSIDGPAAVHDAFRVNRAGRGSHADALRALRLLRKEGAHTDVLCVVHAANAPAAGAVYRFFRDEGVRYLQLLPLVEKDSEQPSGVSGRTARPKDVGRFFCEVFDRWIAHDLGKIVVQTFDEAFRVACHVPHALCIFRETCGDVWVLEHDGSLYACDHYVDEEHRLGSLGSPGLSALIERGAAIGFGEAKQGSLPRQCRSCDVLAYCNGGCPKDRLAMTDDGEPGLNYLCTAYRRLFRHARPVLERLAVHWKAGGPLGQFDAAERRRK